MTMRNRRAAFPLITALAVVALGGAGCATPGPLHVYTTPSAQPPAISDRDERAAVDVPSFLTAGETLTGFAYDPFTDHLFLRLTPGNRFRVVDRPARAIKREFLAEGIPATGGGDLAVRPRDGHLFLADPTEASVVELSRFGQFVRAIPLAATGGPVGGIAYDSVRNHLLVVVGVSPARLITYALDGRSMGEVAFGEPIARGSIGFDSEKRELYAPLARRQAIGVFAEDGKLLRTLPGPAVFVDVGPRSFLRLF